MSSYTADLTDTIKCLHETLPQFPWYKEELWTLSQRDEFFKCVYSACAFPVSFQVTVLKCHMKGVTSIAIRNLAQEQLYVPIIERLLSTINACTGALRPSLLASFLLTHYLS